MSEEIMENKFFCGAKYRPETCMQSNNICCLKCEYIDSCIGLTKHQNKTRTNKIPIPCTTKIIGANEICEFVC